MSRRAALKICMLVLDTFLINIAFFGALFLRFEGSVPALYMEYYKSGYIIITGIVMFGFMWFDLYDRLWRFASINEVVAIVLASTVGVGLTFAYTNIFAFIYPWSIYFLFWLILTVLVGGYRLIIRVFWGHYIIGSKGYPDTIKVMVVGAGDASKVVVEEFLRHPELKRRPVVLVDDDKDKLGLKIRGVVVEGKREDIPRLVAERSIDEIIIAMPSAEKKEIRDVIKICNATKCALKILPGIYELIDGRVTVKRLRDVKIEDLLGRDSVKVDINEISGYMKGKRILVTGGGGSIGSELCRQIAAFEPGELLILDLNENTIHDLEYDLCTTHPELKYRPLVGSIRDVARMDRIFKDFRPDIVFHAAAHKHVPLMELNPLEAIKNNVIGTLNIAELADKYDVQRFILISTDKAVNPTNIMGATKRIAEIIIQMSDRTSATVYSAVRFGNVLGSSGSVVPLFTKQIQAGGPVTVTHKDVIRYFMTIPEAVQLVIQAGAFSRGGEIFILDMGDPVKIEDLANDMIRLSGLVPGEDIEIKYTGLRPGEKLFEELLLNEEGITATKNDRIFIAKPTYMDPATFAREIEGLKDLLAQDKDSDFRHAIREIVPTYNGVPHPDILDS